MNTLIQLNKLNELLTVYEHDFEWELKDESFDAISVLQGRISRMKRHSHLVPNSPA